MRTIILLLGMSGLKAYCEAHSLDTVMPMALFIVLFGIAVVGDMAKFLKNLNHGA